MAIEVLELHHHGIRVGPTPDAVKKAHDFYHTVLGLSPDPGRPQIPSIDGYWMDVGGTAQIHLMGVDGQSQVRQGPGARPSSPPWRWPWPTSGARQELDRLGVATGSESVVGPQSQQIFMRPAGNMIELHQVDTCRCVTSGGPPPPFVDS
jgi:catechol 2,3-dioxygenase-like lactoylglutathione lyase family enzyme